MDVGSFFRISAVVLIAIIFIIIGTASPYIINASKVLLNSIETIQDPIAIDLFSHILAVITIAVILFNYHAVFAYFRRTFTPLDELIVGDWFVYRYTKTQGKPILLKDKWIIRRNFLSKQYIVDVEPLQRRRTHGKKHSAKLSYNERDRLNILLEGFDHKEQSLVCFSPRIPVTNDTRLLGLGVGDDADYVLSARPYLASRRALTEAHVIDVLNYASKNLKEKAVDQLIQLRSESIIEIFSNHPLSDDCFEPKLVTPKVRFGFRRSFPFIGAIVDDF